MLFQRLRDPEFDWSGIDTQIAYDPESDSLHVARQAPDVAPMLEANHREYLSGNGYTPSRDLQRVASIPNVIVEQWLKAGINLFDENDWPKVAALLDSPEYLFLRTAPGRLSRGRNRTYFTRQGRRRSSAEQIQQIQRGAREGT